MRTFLPAPCAPGRVLIDDRPVGEYDRKWLKQRVALVSQEPVLYARSIRRWAPAGSLHALLARHRPFFAAEARAGARDAQAGA